MIGSCDYCGEYCSSLAVTPAEWFELPSGWIPRSAIERHQALVNRRMECADKDGGGFVVGAHVGPWHDRRGRPLDVCPNCADDTAMDQGYWDSNLDHDECPVCAWAAAGGGHLLRSLSHRNAKSRLTKLRARTTGPIDHTAPADRRRVEAAFTAYVRRPVPIRWVASPVEVVNALVQAAPDKDGVRDGWSLWETLTSSQVPEDAVSRVLATGLARAGVDAPSLGLVSEILTDVGQFDRHRLVRRGARRSDAALAQLIEVLHRSSGPLVVLRHEIVASERAVVLRLDGQRRPHAEDGPAIAYGDGLTVYAWHGVVVDPWVVDEPSKIDVAAIDGARNAEVRRVLIERFGAERLVREGDSELVHEDETGRLWRRSVGPVERWGGRREEAITMIEVLNSTPGPDGSVRTYFLRVPPTTTTAREGVAWTFGMRGAEYAPAIQS